MKLIIVQLFIIAMFAINKSQSQAPDCVSIARSTPKDVHKYYYPHDQDCSKYYQCADYGLVLKSCPEGLFFDRNEFICGRDYEVQC